MKNTASSNPQKSGEKILFTKSFAIPVERNKFNAYIKRTMPTKNEIKLIKSLKLKKFRNELHLFVAEGEKLVSHLLKQGLESKYVFTTNVDASFANAEVISKKEMEKLTFLNSASTVFGVFKKPALANSALQVDFVFLLDGIRDPGNLGTIIRLCDWFGVKQLLCTDDCVDVFNEKVVQASMGSIASVQVLYNSRQNWIEEFSAKNYKLIGTEMNAPSVFEVEYQPKSILVLGNEGQGISDELKRELAQTVSIPAAPSSQAESLNVAMSAGIFLSDFARKSNL